MLEFISIIMLIFGVLQIILFFKIWGMTNDVRELRNFIVSRNFPSNAPTLPTQEISSSSNEKRDETYDERIETLNVGDEVILKSSGQRVEITKVWGSYFIVNKPEGKVCISKKDVIYVEK